MFRIRQEQLDELAVQSQAAFRVKMQSYLRSAFAPWVAAMDEGSLEAWLGEAIERCSRFGVTTEPEAAQLVLLLMVLGLDVEERHPFAAPILRDRGLLPLGKVRALVRAARAERIGRLEEVLVFREMAAPEGSPAEAAP